MKAILQKISVCWSYLVGEKRLYLELSFRQLPSFLVVFVYLHQSVPVLLNAFADVVDLSLADFWKLVYFHK